MNNHFKTSCKVLWLEHGRDGNSSSESLQPYFRLSQEGYKFDVQDIRKSFVVIWHKITTIFERIESGNYWQIRVFSQKDTDDVDINYWYPESDLYDRKIKLSIKPLFTINEKATFHRIPFEAEEVNFEPPQPEGTLEDFLHRIMEEEQDHHH